MTMPRTTSIRLACLLLLCALSSTPALAAGVAAPASAASAASKEILPGAQVMGQGKLRYFGFEIYKASLSAEPGFTATRFADHRFALELQYLRKFKGADIAQRSLDEMRPIAQASGQPISAELAKQWQQRMAELFPDVASGDRITGVNLPGRGAQFFLNGKALGTVDDPRFAALFFGIWLSPRTSEPALRQALVANAGRNP